MNNNIVGVNLNVDKDYLQEAVKQTVLMGISESLNGKNEIVSQIVKSVLDTKVDKTGRISSYSGDNKYTILEFYVNQMLTEIVKEEIKSMIEEKRGECAEIIRKELNKKANINKFVDNFIDSTSKTLDTAWKTTININYEKENGEW
nr:MAG TPA: hypothetical protein [Caudoviricetes sp.]